MLDWRSARALVPAALLSLAAARAHAEPITLEDALTRAQRANTDLLTAVADVSVAEGERSAASQLAYNPEIAVAAGPDFGADTTLYDVELGLAQTIELGGKRGGRSQAAEARLAAARARLETLRWTTEVRVRHAYALTIVERRRLERAREAETVAAEFLAAAQQRLRLGAGTQLEINVAISDQGRVKHDRLDAERRLEAAHAELAAAIGARASASLDPVGEPREFRPLALTEDAFVARALARRPDLVALEAEVTATGAEVRAADAQAIPDLTVSVTYDREEEPELTKHTLLAGVAMPIPIFNRNQGNRRAARARLGRARLLADAGRVHAERQARTAFRNYDRAREAVLGFDETVVSRLGENLTLARQSFVAGKIGYLEYNVLRRELIATGFAYLDALAEAVDAWRDAALAAGAPLEVSP